MKAILTFGRLLKKHKTFLLVIQHKLYEQYGNEIHCEVKDNVLTVEAKSKIIEKEFSMSWSKKPKYAALRMMGVKIQVVK